jgi:hypothetical protein
MASDIMLAVDKPAKITRKTQTNTQSTKGSVSRKPATGKWHPYSNKIVSLRITAVPSSSKREECADRVLPFRVKKQDFYSQFLPGSATEQYSSSGYKEGADKQHPFAPTGQQLTVRVHLFTITL